MSETEAQTMPVEAALQVLAELRNDQTTVITNQGSARLWPRLTHHPGDLNYNPSTMGGAVALGLGIALAQPGREIVVVSGDGSLLMSLGSLVSVRDSGATNFTVLLLDNGMYEVTGQQHTPARQGVTDFVGVAAATGFPTAHGFDQLTDWQEQAARVLAAPGPRFVSLRVDAIQNDCLQDAAEPMADQLKRLREVLGECGQ